MQRFKSISTIATLAFMLVTCGRPSVNIIQVKGSDTEVNLALTLAERYMDIDSLASISVSGGGSGVGIAALINSKTDIANSSRPMKKEEIDQAKAMGVNPYPVIFSVDGLAIIVNASNPIDTIDFNTLSNIFKGTNNNWNQLGGSNLSISPYGRQSNSGTFVFFRDFVVKADYAQNVKSMNGNAQIVEAVKADKSGIGYVGVGYAVDSNGKVADGLKVLRVTKTSGTPAITPTKVENVTSGLYPLTRPLFQITNGKPEGAKLRFIQFELSDEGQKMILKNGYYPITKEQVELNKQLGITP